MTAVHSPRWYRVASLKPRLSPQLRLQRQRLRGEIWYVLSDPGLGRSVRLNAGAYALAGRLDGSHTVQQIWDWTLLHGHDSATQDEVIDILAQLREAALVLFDRAADFEVLLPHLDQVVRPGGRNSLLAWRFPLGNPSALLDRLQPLQRLLFSRAMLAVWLLLVLMLLLLGLQHATGLWAFGQIWMATPRFAALALLLFIPIKLLHELAHGMAVRRWGGQVREAGVTFMLLMPVPYVDASAASNFAQRRHRMAVGAAGIMAEVVLAALALPLWLWLQDGLLRDAAFVTFMIAGVSTLVFNANPLQRLDGYYIVTDALELPNLGPRSKSWWLDALRRRLLRVPGTEPIQVARAEGPWLAAYAPLAWLYSLLVATLAVAWLGQLSLALGLLGGALLLWQMVVRPAVRLFGQLSHVALTRADSARRWHWLLAVGAAAAAAVVLAPLPQSTLVQGVIWPPDQAQLRSEEAGFVEAVFVRDGQDVKAGDVVLRLANPQLVSSHERQVARVSALETSFVDAGGSGTVKGDGRAGDARADLIAAQAGLDRLSARIAALVVTAQADGRVALPNAADLPGQFVRRGSLIGQVLTGAPPTIRVALADAQAMDPHQFHDAASVRLAASPGTARSAMLTRDSVAAVMQLPSAALSARHGGDVLTDPRDPDDLKPLQPVVVLDVRLAVADKLAVDGLSDAASQRVGERAWVRFESGWSPLAMQWALSLRRQFLRRFNPQF